MDFSVLSGMSLTWESFLPTVLLMAVLYAFNWRKTRIENKAREEENAEKEKQVEKLRAEIDQMKLQTDSTILSGYKAQIGDMNERLTQVIESGKQERMELMQQNNQLKQKVDDLETKLDLILSENKQLKAQINKLAEKQKSMTP
jgi:uncharacterized phage infection (PIP) family protein YhgE